MLKDIIALLNDNSALISLLGGAHIYPYTTDYLGDCIIYNYVSAYDDKAKQKIRIQFSIISSTLLKALQIEETLKTILLTLGDEQLNTNILKVEQNGGGSLYDYNRQKYHHYIYLDIIGRSEENND